MRLIIYLATQNAGKIREMRQILTAALPDADLRSVADLDAAQKSQYFADETGSTYAENALIKAQALGKIVTRTKGSRTIILADDSGFEVEALGGAPGVYSARFGLSHEPPPAGDRPGASTQGAMDDAARCTKIIMALSGKKGEDRRAKFVACIALIENDKNPVLIFGRKMGYVAHAPRGQTGFGYDPIFCPASVGQTWAEMSAVEKNAHSHRSRALDLVIRYLVGVNKGNTQYLH